MARATGVTLRQLQWWDERSILKPRMIGHTRRYSFRDVVAVRLIKELRDKHLPLRFAVFVLRNAAKNSALVEDRDMLLITDGREVKWRSVEEGAIAAASRWRGPVFVVDVGELARTVRAALSGVEE